MPIRAVIKGLRRQINRAKHDQCERQLCSFEKLVVAGHQRRGFSRHVVHTTASAGRAHLQR